MRSFHIPLALVVIIVLSASRSDAQISITERHRPYTTDTLLAYKLPYIAVTDSGRNCVWNFANLPEDSSKYVEVNYYPVGIDTTHIGLHREQTNYYYTCLQDTLWLTEYETSLMHVLYNNPIPCLYFPMTYGDSLCTTFTGDGKYCHMSSYSVAGECRVYVDAVGKLVLPDMVVDSVLRVCSRKRYRATMHHYGDIEEISYRWYSPYGHSPLFESLQVQTVSGQDTGLFAASYCFHTDEDLSIPRRVKNDTLDAPVDSLITNVRYMPNPVYSDLQVQYTLTKSVQVYISVHYNGGTSVYQTPLRREEEGPHCLSIPMGGMPIGNYVVYIHADNNIASGGIIKL